jgi:hypothetical protein
VLTGLARVPYSDVRLLGRLVTGGRAWPVAGVAVHLANGAAFGAAFELAGLRGARAGIIAAQVENLAFWPAMAVVDRVHPDRRNGTWPPLLRNRRIALYEVTVHALFGAVLGALVKRRTHRHIVDGRPLFTAQAASAIRGVISGKSITGCATRLK